ncbi:MAG: hypothetical protein OXB95_08065 [Rhodobacteraceae bacterium]|nr:hypothetical protein [Paracoccaceae bacterium]
MRKGLNGELASADPKGLIAEAYSIEGISEAECRTIFLEWAMTLRSGIDPIQALKVLLEHYQPDCANHHMTALLAEGAASGKNARSTRRGRERTRSGRTRPCRR